MSRIKVPHLPFYYVENDEENWKELIETSRAFKEHIRNEARKRLDDSQNIDISDQDINVAANAIDYEQVYRDYLEFKGIGPERVD